MCVEKSERVCLSSRLQKDMSMTTDERDERGEWKKNEYESVASVYYSLRTILVRELVVSRMDIAI